MEARYHLYTSLKKAISTHLNGVVKHVGLWNQDTEFLEESMPFERPAVFVEFGPITWDTVFKAWPVCARGVGDVKLHVVVDWNGDQDSAIAMDLSQKVAGVLMSISDIEQGYAVMKPGQTLTNHDHEQILENIEVLSVKWQQVYDMIEEE